MVIKIKNMELKVKKDMFMVLIWYYDRPNVYDYNYYL